MIVLIVIDRNMISNVSFTYGVGWLSFCVYRAIRRFPSYVLIQKEIVQRKLLNPVYQMVMELSVNVLNAI